jgi:hypothetical protein
VLAEASAGDAAERAAREEEARASASLAPVWEAQSDRTLRREWDLSDPHILRKERPPRVGDDLAEGVGPSSGQVFEGEKLEDPAIDERARAELIAANAALLEERAMRVEVERRRLAAEDAEILASAAEGDAAERRVRDQERLAAMRYALENKTLARSARLRESEAKEAEDRLGRAAVAAGMSDPIITEDYSLGAGVNGRVRREHFKGMSREQLERIRLVQEAQQRELQVKSEREREAAERAEAMMRASIASADAMERDARQREAEEKKKYYLELKAQQRADRQRRLDETQTRKARFDETAGGVLSKFGTSLR